MIPRRPEAGSLTLTLLSVATEGSGAIFGGSFFGVFWLVFRRFLARFSWFSGRFSHDLGVILGCRGKVWAGRRKKSPAHRCAPGRSWRSIS